MNITHELWRHKNTGAVYAVRLVDGVPRYQSGPLYGDEYRKEFLTAQDFEYDDDFGFRLGPSMEWDREELPDE